MTIQSRSRRAFDRKRGTSSTVKEKREKEDAETWISVERWRYSNLLVSAFSIKYDVNYLPKDDSSWEDMR